MFTLTLENSKKADLIYSYIKENFDLSSCSIKKCSENIEFEFYNLTDLYREFSLSFTDLIIYFYEQKLVKNILKKNYFYFSDEEQDEILDICNSMLNGDESHHKKDLIFLSVHDYMQNNSLMNLDGFVNFRLRDYIEILDYLVDLAVNNFIINREYIRFIDLLQEYIYTSTSKINVAHLIYLGKESILLDEYNNPLPIDEHILDAKYLSDISFSTNDYVLNTLLNLLPQKLYIHILEQEDEFISTLKKIFKNRIHICYECEICDFYKTTTNFIHSDIFD